ncbi:MAG: hypothetical protein A2W90_10405 [Bacteroidetes bacterium GWF2_42_66]|nr:MAG: hypothetical protein A2W92_24100 [Bacteroidetes bacterium GWA2_42_15]OFY01498.1 MAG: hypothetical protein A2W89_02110 [Bacteroidetes bacterium GWE2_42_39]OFY43321.1 MAG: hypothetical protein A2W90_10405 [Bacteroidetes bacterium GWF2_42_66]HBL77496.1 hypothetical protein [Prolixibacteraceae bacterium]HCR89368.1 hypothetical protein [Prolixibacteraceae bacterium]
MLFFWNNGGLKSKRTEDGLGHFRKVAGRLLLLSFSNYLLYWYKRKQGFFSSAAVLFGYFFQLKGKSISQSGFRTVKKVSYNLDSYLSGVEILLYPPKISIDPKGRDGSA